MKRFLILFVLIGLLLVALDYLYFYNGDYYLPVKTTVSAISGTMGDKLSIDRGQGPEPFEVRGVSIGLGSPGHFSTDPGIKEEEYLRWFAQIQAMGANVIQTYTIASPVFYEAFYTYNLENPQPLYLLHGVWVDSYLSHSSHSAFDEDFYRPFLDACKSTVDVIHGRFKTPAGKLHFTRNYRRDISPWVYGYILGSEWDTDLVVYTNDCLPQVPQWEGDYFSTEDARNFEVFLASVADKMTGYETGKYGTHRAMSFGNAPQTAPLKFSLKNEYLSKKYASVDPENILPTEAFTGAYFASCPVYPYAPEQVRFERDGQDIENTYLQYLTLLNRHHSIPVLISEFGIPTSRAMASYEDNRAMGRDQGRMNEKQQGQALVSLYQDILASGSTGGVLLSWQDEWHKEIWNTLPSIDLERNAFWSDLQSASAHYGLLAFEPGKEQRPYIIDGRADDWEDDQVVFRGKGMTLSLQYDLEGICLLLQKPGLDLQKDRLYIPIDLTPKSGSTECREPALTMTRPADFLVVIDGRENSRVLVQERYEALNAIFGQSLHRGYNPFTQAPEKDSPVFVPIQLPLLERRFVYLDPETNIEHPLTYEQFDAAEINRFHFPQLYETGVLHYGNGDPDSPEFDSLGDFCAGANVLELRLPWQLLNFSDPTLMKIHDDYYQHYGVEDLSIRKLYIGAGDGTAPIEMESCALRPLGHKPQTHERLKQSYGILRDYWRSLP